MAFRMVTGEIGALDHFKIENAHRQCLQGAHAGAQPHDSTALAPPRRTAVYAVARAAAAPRCPENRLLRGSKEGGP